MNLTYIFPVRIESDDRLRNIITSISYLLYHFPESRVLVKEVDSESVFKKRALPKIKEFVSVDNLNHIFEKSDNQLFYKTKILNDLILESDTEVIASHDVDVVYPKQSHLLAYDIILNGNADLVYPYGCGAFQFQVNYFDQLFESFTKDYDVSQLNSHSKKQASSIGWTQFYSKKSVINAGLWNENFVSWGEEDSEFYFRFSTLGYRIERINDYIYHFEHQRTYNSHYHNPKYIDNHNLWQWIRTQSREQLVSYLTSQEYLKQRLKNVSI